MLEFQLFRLKMVFPAQQNLFNQEPPRAELLRQATKELSSAILRKGIKWHIGNVEAIGEHGLYFRLGRSAQTKFEVFAEGQFLDEEFETAPYTHVMINVDLEVCAIAKKTKLSPTTSGIAKRLARLLQTSPPSIRAGVTIEIDEINDPEDFIQHLRNAYAISKFSVWFSLPNPWDVEEDFIRPAQKLVKESNGKQGKTELKGESLNSVVLEDISRSAATTGDEAIAIITTAADGKRIKKRLRGNPILLLEEDVGNVEEKQGFLDRLTDLYQRIRHSKELS
jgi:hypothetical protein